MIIKLYITTMKEIGQTRDVYILIRELAKALRIFQDGAVFCEDITFTQYVILDYIYSSERLKLSDLHKLLAVEKSTTTRLLDPLMRKNLIIKEKSPVDSRAIELELTGEGERIYGSVKECMENLVGQLLDVLPEKQEEPLINSMNTFVRSIFKCCGTEQCC